MQGPITDIVRLLVLVVFFGVQQRGRSRSYARFWFVGWIFVFLSYVVWAVTAASPMLVHMQRVFSFDFMLLGALSFLLALLAADSIPWKIMAAGMAIGVANVVLLNASEFVAIPKWAVALVIVLWQVDGLCMGYMLLPRSWTQRRWQIFALCMVYGSAMLAYVAMAQTPNLNNWAIGEVLLCTAIMYRKWGQRRSVARWVGTVGFVGWAALYLAKLMGHSPQMQRLLYEFSSFPEYFIAFTMFLKVMEEATEEKARLSTKYRDLYEDFRLLYESHPYPMWIADAAGGEFLSANEAALKVYGYALEEFRGMRMEDLELEEDPDEEDIFTALQASAEGTLARHLHKDGNVMWVNLMDRDSMYMGREARFVIARDITERLMLHRDLAYRAQHDVLTGLPNRQLLADRLAQCLKSCERDQKRAAILTIDVDHFKSVNDTYGHGVGDECLQMVAERLKSKIRKVDTIARTGGEEFMAVVSALTLAIDAEKVAESLLRVFDRPLELSIGGVPITVSIGVAIYPDDGTGADELRALSDEAVYRAKREGRNRAAYGHEVTARRNYTNAAPAAPSAVIR